MYYYTEEHVYHKCSQKTDKNLDLIYFAHSMQVELCATCIDTSISILFLLSPSKVGKNNNINIVLSLSLGNTGLVFLFYSFLNLLQSSLILLTNQPSLICLLSSVLLTNQPSNLCSYNQSALFPPYF